MGDVFVVLDVYYLLGELLIGSRIPMRSLVIAAFLILGITPAQAAIIDTFTLNMNGTAGLTGLNSNVSLALGTPYIIMVSGTFEISCVSGGCPTDAEYYVPATGANAGLPFSLTGFDSPSGVDVGVQIDGAKIDWGPFNPSRIYSTTYLGLGNTIFVNYLDTNYGDNSGSLDITISTLEAVVPIPAAVWLFGTALVGLIGFSKRRKAV